MVVNELFLLHLWLEIRNNIYFKTQFPSSSLLVNTLVELPRFPLLVMTITCLTTCAVMALTQYS